MLDVLLVDLLAALTGVTFDGGRALGRQPAEKPKSELKNVIAKHSKTGLSADEHRCRRTEESNDSRFSTRGSGREDALDLEGGTKIVKRFEIRGGTDSSIGGEGEE